MKEGAEKMGKVSVERLAHFQCGECRRWWSVGDIPAGHKGLSYSGSRRVWFCPWCGLAQKMAKIEAKP